MLAGELIPSFRIILINLDFFGWKSVILHVYINTKEFVSPGFRDELGYGQYIEVNLIAILWLWEHLKVLISRRAAISKCFSGLRASKLSPRERGIACGTDNTIGVPLSRLNIFHVKAHFRWNALCATILDVKIGTKTAWLEIIDDNHHQQAIVFLWIQTLKGPNSHELSQLWGQD